MLTQYNDKYQQYELSEEEKNYINKSLKNINNDNKVYNDIFSSLQILMNEILKENYQQNYLIYDIIQKIPKYVILNEELIKLIENRYNDVKNSFTINSLVSIFEYFEELCWENIKKYIPEDFKTPIDEKIMKNIRHYFEKNKNNEKKLIDKIIFTKAIRKLISRYIVGTRQETDIKPEIELKLHIIKPEFWPKNIIDDNDMFNLQIDEIFKSKINVEQSLELYNSLQGDENQFKNLNIEEQEQNNIDLISFNSINTEISFHRDDTKKNKINGNKPNKQKIEIDEKKDKNNTSVFYDYLREIPNSEQRSFTSSNDDEKNKKPNTNNWCKRCLEKCQII